MISFTKTTEDQEHITASVPPSQKVSCVSHLDPFLENRTGLLCVCARACMHCACAHAHTTPKMTNRKGSESRAAVMMEKAMPIKAGMKTTCEVQQPSI